MVPTAAFTLVSYRMHLAKSIGLDRSPTTVIVGSE